MQFPSLPNNNQAPSLKNHRSQPNFQMPYVHVYFSHLKKQRANNTNLGWQQKIQLVQSKSTNFSQPKSIPMIPFFNNKFSYGSF